MADEREHSEISMSGFSRIVACPASLSLSAEAPEPPPHPAGIEGTDFHTCAETLVKSKNFDKAAKMLLKTYPDTMVEHAIAAVGKIFRVRNDLDKDAKIMSEVRLDTSEFTAPNNFGTADIIIPAVRAKTLVVEDFKYGVVPVEVRDNWQLTGYALAASIKFKHAFKFIRMGVIQPRGRTEAPTHRHHTVTLKELLAWKPRFLAAVARTRVKNPVVQSGTHCYFCPAREYNCPVYNEKKRGRMNDAFKGTDSEDWLTAFLLPKQNLTRRKNG